ncbi:uncharacterized protein LOC111613125 [Centruroides sculpturatus]|uniref:uncharacterized protein LOC111613125 n=1 Tax=Centruroides sculpturatus TaxID=218467 RepID=UPI000C6EB7DE|nr:uncharacterized protein LOC111613125 [Centruroides sculpturatus]
MSTWILICIFCSLFVITTPALSTKENEDKSRISHVVQWSRKRSKIFDHKPGNCCHNNENLAEFTDCSCVNYQSTGRIYEILKSLARNWRRNDNILEKRRDLSPVLTFLKMNSFLKYSKQKPSHSIIHFGKRINRRKNSKI